MDNDKAFAAYALLLAAGVASVITASVMAGITSLPSPLVFLEHVALSLAFRAAYKGFGGFRWDDWSLAGVRPAAALPTPEPAPEPAPQPTIDREAA